MQWITMSAYMHGPAGQAMHYLTAHVHGPGGQMLLSYEGMWAWSIWLYFALL